jgi:Lipocalin-like domain
MINSDLTPSASHDPMDLVGTWKLISVLTEQDGRKFDAYGPNAKGLLVFDANGRYSIIFIAGGLPSFGSGNRSSGTAEEAMAVVVGSLAHFTRGWFGATPLVGELPRSNRQTAAWPAARA